MDDQKLVLPVCQLPLYCKFKFRRPFLNTKSNTVVEKFDSRSIPPGQYIALVGGGGLGRGNGERYLKWGSREWGSLRNLS